MKKVFQIFGLLLAVVLLANCGGKKGPEAIAEKFLNHLNKKEYAEAKKLGTEATIQMISFMEQFPADNEVTEAPKIENMKCEVAEEKATCKYTQNGQEEEVQLVKVNGEWKVDMPKETPDFDDMDLDYEEGLEEVDTMIEPIEAV